MRRSRWLSPRPPASSGPPAASISHDTCTRIAAAQASLGRVPDSDRLKTARDSYRAYETGDRDLIESVLADDFTFYSPPDPGLDRAQYFERCWPNAARL